MPTGSELQTRASSVLFPDVNHVLKRVTTDDRAANIATYADQTLPIAPEVVDAIAAFILQAPAQPPARR